LAGELASAPFNAGRPLWSFHLVERYQGGSALIVRIHHCYADGIALMHVLANLADEQLPSARGAAAPGTGDGPGLLAQTFRKYSDPLEAAAASREALGLAGELARLGVGMADDPATRLKQPLSGVKRVAWGEPL